MRRATFVAAPPAPFSPAALRLLTARPPLTPPSASVPPENRLMPPAASRPRLLRSLAIALDEVEDT